MQSAPKTVAFEARRFAAPDPRADGRRRFVRLDGDKVAIDRVVGGVFMRVTVPTSAYRGVALRVVDAREDGFAYEIRLVHARPRPRRHARRDQRRQRDSGRMATVGARARPAGFGRARRRPRRTGPATARPRRDQAVGAAPARQDHSRAPAALPRPPQARPAGAVRESRKDRRAVRRLRLRPLEATVPAFRKYALTTTPARRLWLSPADRPISGRCAPTSSRR